jgi:Fur family ferric uptake transcriptional regulator
METIKYTNQRVEILKFLKDNKTHPTVEDIYRGVRKKLSRISKATVYQNLKFLAEKGIIKEVNIKGVSRFEPNIKPHHHIICSDCGRIIDFESKDLTDYSMKIARQFKDMAVEGTDTHFHVICSECNKKKAKNS